MPDTCLFCRWCRVLGAPHGATQYRCTRTDRELRSSDVSVINCSAFERGDDYGR